MKLVTPSDGGRRCDLSSPTAMPKAAGFLWNSKMMVQATCRGYATAQFMQPEPAKYSHAPNIEAKTFMQPEQSYYADHPGRFVYIRDLDRPTFFSAPYEPVRQPLDTYTFSAGKSDLRWTSELDGLRVDMVLSLPTDDVAELWTVTVKNTSSAPRNVSVTPYFVIGYMSWMNQSADYREDLGGIVASSITPYQKIDDYFKNKTLQLKDKTYFLCDTPPDSYETVLDYFQGEGGLHAPSSLLQDKLGCNASRYETPAAVVQYRIHLDAGEQNEFRFIFGPAYDDAEILSIRDKYLGKDKFAAAAADYARYIGLGRGVLQIETPDSDLDTFVNHWLPRQVYYHGGVNRLTTDPQTRNYLQDNMGMAYIQPATLRRALLTALSQQEATGAMPDGILLTEGAELKYINQVPHTDHCVWLPIALDAYLSETGDYAILNEPVASADSTLSVADRMSRAMHWLLSSRDERGLSYIAQGDWCDPMNMVGYKGKGVSGWLTLATGYALRLWVSICQDAGLSSHETSVFETGCAHVNAAANTHLWDGDWFARGITDDGVVFGTSKDANGGRLWLNPQSWALLSGAASPEQAARILPQIDEQLATPYGVAMFAPPFQGMREDVGRVTQKFPGSAENGAVYNHAGVFYAHSLYDVHQGDRAYAVLRQMLAGPDDADYRQRGQLPIYIPNYYRGAFHLYPRTAGRSSQLFNTGTVSWAYRCFIEGLCGLRGVAAGLHVSPQLPTHWPGLKATRQFRGATFVVSVERVDVKGTEVYLDGQPEKLPGGVVTDIEAGKTYEVKVLIA
ncbi:glycoside hydrolase family 94 protein [Ophiostoma piceae UAMH 11346]|uniref:Glycoside hydrolase family 94 protein n=1 Tax=Ophiostoma piceae (strain UAMH 11346) TaxID=1262450 RepID=S3BV31_OPHP1|nr:glycoside hydrolase family 94 protein [Ophiostoma piceae UAMH 11346]